MPCCAVWGVLITCSEMCANAIVYFVNEVLQQPDSHKGFYQLRKPDPELSKWVIGPVLTGLYREAIVFDFGAVRSSFTKRTVQRGELDVLDA